ncbi:hypothetical protein RMR21_022215 [Agrobacterium sp. rho-8.1]|nr:hypothetical protein [Agrobacterium sp. rho-8.1]
MLRFEKRRNIANEFWTVIDSFMDRPATIDGVPLDTLTEDEADELIVLLEANHIRVDGPDTTP